MDQTPKEHPVQYQSMLRWSALDVFSMCYSMLCCVHQVIPVHSSSSCYQPNTLPFLNVSLSVLGIILWLWCLPGHQNPPWPQLCFSSSVQSLQSQPPPYAYFRTTNHNTSSSYRVHPVFTQTLWGLTKVWGGCKLSYVKKQISFQIPNIQNGPPAIMSLCWLLKPTNYT